MFTQEIRTNNLESNNFFKKCDSPAKTSLIVLAVGAIITVLGIILSHFFYVNVALSISGYLFSTVGGVLILTGIVGLVYIYAKKQMLNQNNNPQDQFTSPKRSISTLTTPPVNRPAEHRLPFNEKMNFILAKHTYKNIKEEKLSKRAFELTLQDLRKRTKIKGKDNQNQNYLALKVAKQRLFFSEEKSLWVFRETVTGKTILYKDGKNSGEPFSDQHELDQVKQALSS